VPPKFKNFSAFNIVKLPRDPKLICTILLNPFGEYAFPFRQYLFSSGDVMWRNKSIAKT
jgi:hypothetical protein